MKKQLVSILASACLMSVGVGASTTASAYHASVCTDQGGNLNLRSGPSINAKRVASLKNGTPVYVLQHYGEWTQVRAGKRTGWAYNYYICG